MKDRGLLRLRMIADLVLICLFGFAAPPLFAPIGRSWGVLLASFATMFISFGFLYDGIRTLERLRKPDSN
jgi:hypothetical protein